MDGRFGPFLAVLPAYYLIGLLECGVWSVLRSSFPHSPFGRGLEHADAGAVLQLALYVAAIAAEKQGKDGEQYEADDHDYDFHLILLAGRPEGGMTTFPILIVALFGLRRVG